jgi:peptide chain release factor 1
MTPNYSSWISAASTRNDVSGTVFDFAIVDQRPGIIVTIIRGAKEHIFQSESGGHRWQRIPPTEKRGRVQTSTITVAVLPEPTAVEDPLKLHDLDWMTCRSGGKGGQNVNKVESAVQIRHRPTGLIVRCESERSQLLNKQSALEIMRAKLWDAARTQQSNAIASDRKQQVGAGMRGDKRRTIRVRDGAVVDHVTGQRWKFDDYIAGRW